MKLHTTDAVALVEVWTGLKNYVPAKDQKQAAEQFIASIDDAGLVDVGMCSSEMYGVDDTFDAVLRTYCEENGLLEDNEHEEWDE
jgi:hypothetical protein